jgi:DNA-binding PadR family transcriptional regulator
MARDALGEFEHQVLLAILQLGGRSYSAPIVMELEERTARSVSPAAVFIALRRLEQRGYLRSSKQEPDPGEGGRGRRTFQITPTAIARLRDSRRTFENLWRGLDPILDRP